MAIVFHSTSPVDGADNQERDVEIVVSFYSTTTPIIPSDIDAYVDGNHAFNGEYFIIPFDGPNSSLDYALINGYDGYNLTIDRSGLYENSSTVNVIIYVSE